MESEKTDHDESKEEIDEDEMNEEKVDEDGEEDEEVDIEGDESESDGEDPRSYRPKDFLDAEAELSGSDASEDEDEGEDDEYDKELLDDKELDEADEDEIRNQIEQLHHKQMLDEDKRNVLLMQEMYAEDGDLHNEAGARRGNFRWQDDDEDDAWINPESASDSGDTDSSSDEENEAQTTQVGTTEDTPTGSQDETSQQSSSGVAGKSKLSSRAKFNLKASMRTDVTEEEKKKIDEARSRFRMRNKPDAQDKKKPIWGSIASQSNKRHKAQYSNRVFY